MFDKCFQMQAGFCPGKRQIWLVITHGLCGHGKLGLMPEAGLWCSDRLCAQTSQAQPARAPRGLFPSHSIY